MSKFKFYYVTFYIGNICFNEYFSSKKKAIKVLKNNVLLRTHIYLKSKAIIEQDYRGKRVKINDEFFNKTYKNNLKLSFNGVHEMTYEMTIKFSLEEEVEIPEVKMEGVPYRKGRVEYRFIEDKEVVIKGEIHDSGYLDPDYDYTEPTFQKIFNR